MTRLRVDDASVRLGETQALQCVSLDVASGWTAIVGPNGAGKSTLLRVLAGLQATDTGTVHLDGEPLASRSDRARASRIAWLAQQSEPAGELTAHETVALGRLPSTGLFGAFTVADDRAVELAMAETGCSAWRDRRLQDLSGGERQRVLMARAFAVGAPLLLLDEPTTHLDPPHQVGFVRLIRRKLAEGATVLSVLHDLSLALLADRLVVMDAGRIRAEGWTDNPDLHRALVDVCGGAIRVVRFESRWIVVPHLDAP